MLYTIQNQFRQELDFSNFHFLSRGLIDYEHSGSIDCTVLKKVNPNVSILDRRQNPSKCDESEIWLNGKNYEVILQTLNGDKYSLSFVSRNDSLFYLCLWILRALGIIIISCVFYIYYLSRIAADLRLKNEKAIIEERYILSKQVSHDIRSPLSALTMVVGTLKEIPEEKRILIRNATQRINDIANDLLQKSKNIELQTNKLNAAEDTSSIAEKTIKLSTELIPALIDVLISEKRMQYRQHTGLEIEVDFKNSFGAFATIDSIELKRIISNLVNNSAEAFQNYHGKIIVAVRNVIINDISNVEILIKDNGKGIPKNILEKLGQLGITQGKIGIDSGSGLGIYHAKKTIESFGGMFNIESIEGYGTSIHIILPAAELPEWFADKINLTEKKYLVSVDDDISVHQIWADRLQGLGFDKIEHIKFQSGDAFEKYVNSNIGKLAQTMFLVDFEMLNQPKTGLDIIEDLGLEKYAILVTSHYDEKAIHERIARLRLPLLPKGLAGFIPVEIFSAKEKFDWILLDDDDLVRMSWSYAAKEFGKSYLGFKNFAELDAYKNKFDLSSHIYIDSNLGNGIKGEDIAKQLYKDGFRNLYLATGYAEDHFPGLNFIKAIVGKEPPKR